MIQQNTPVSAGRPAVKPRPTPGGRPALPEAPKGPSTKPAFGKPAFGSDGFEPGIKPGGPHWGGGKLPACPLPKGAGGEGKVPGAKFPDAKDLGPKFPAGVGEKGELQPIGPFRVDESIKQFFEKFKKAE